MPQLPVTPGAQRRNRGWAGRWSHWQPASARRGSGTAQCAWRSAGTGGSSHVSHTGWGLWDAGLGASPVGQQPSHQHPQPQLRPHPPAELSMTDTTHAPKAHTQPSSAQGRMERQRCSKRTRDTWPQRLLPKDHWGGVQLTVPPHHSENRAVQDGRSVELAQPGLGLPKKVPGGHGAVHAV